MKVALALAATYRNHAQLEEVIYLQRHIVEAREKVLGYDSHETLIARDQLGTFYCLNGQYYEAFKLYTLTSECMESTLRFTSANILAALEHYRFIQLLAKVSEEFNHSSKSSIISKEHSRCFTYRHSHFY